MKKIPLLKQCGGKNVKISPQCFDGRVKRMPRDDLAGGNRGFAYRLQVEQFSPHQSR